MNALIKILARALPDGLRRSPVVKHAALLVTDENGEILADIPVAGPCDYRVRVDLPNGPVFVDLYGHYQMFTSAGGKVPYRGLDRACRTYVKFGDCIQDKRDLFVLIQPAIQQKSTT